MNFFGCNHRNLSRVFTIDGRSYQCCLTCAKQFLYDLRLMRQVQPRTPVKQQKVQEILRRA